MIREDRLVRRAEEARQERLKHEQTQSYIAQLEGENARLKRALDRRQTGEERGDVRS